MIGDADVVHFHDLDLLPWMSLVSRYRPVVYDVHENYPDEMLVREWIPRWARRPLFYMVRWFQMLLARVVGNIVLVIEAQRDDFPREGIKIAYVKNFAAAALTKQAKDDYSARPNVVLFTGSHYALNGSWLLLDIAERLQLENIDVRFAVAGRLSSEAMRSQWTAEVARRELDGTVQLVPSVAPPDIMAQVNRCTIGINPILRVTKQSKAINTKLFEFMAGGVPFVTSDLEFPSWLVRETGAGMLDQPESPSSFAAAIKQLVEEQARAEEMGKRGRTAFLEQFTWESQMPTLADFYQEVSIR